MLQLLAFQTNVSYTDDKKRSCVVTALNEPVFKLNLKLKKGQKPDAQIF